MKKSFSAIFLFLLLFTGLSLQAKIFHPKVKIRINEGSGNTNVNDGNEVKLPIGLPFSTGDLSLSGDDNGAFGQPSKIVYTFDLPDGQGPQSFHETHSAFVQARSMNAACVLIRMNTMSGALDAAENLSNEITDYDRPVMVYVNDRAFPASTLISMAADNKKNIANGKKNKRAINPKEKTATNSYEQKFKFSSESDENYCRTGIPNFPLGKQYSSGQNGDLDDVLTQAGLNNYMVVHYSPGFFAQLIDWCMKPFMSLLLIILISLGIRLQMNSSFPGPATFLLLVSIPLFGVPLFVGGLAGIGEFSLALFLAIGIIVIGKNKSASLLLRFIPILLFIGSLTLCQFKNIGPITNWNSILINLLLTALTFVTGFYLPVFLSKLSRTSRSAMVISH